MRNSSGHLAAFFLIFLPRVTGQVWLSERQHYALLVLLPQVFPLTVSRPNETSSSDRFQYDDSTTRQRPRHLRPLLPPPPHRSMAIANNAMSKAKATQEVHLVFVEQ